VLQLRTNQLVVWFVKVHVSIELLVNLLNPHFETPACPFTLEALRAKERTATLSPSIVFTFGLVVESINEPFSNIDWTFFI
jgi:hypothetical protein